MPISTTDQLFVLIKSMTKAEKRAFKLYAKRTQSQQEARFIRLFDILDKQDKYNEKQIFKRFDSLSKGQLSNLKRHLYSQILSSLRLIHISKDIEIQIREQIDYAQVLYGKGLYMQALKILNRVMSISKDANKDILHYQILDFKKLIEEKHITRSRSVENEVENLLDESSSRIEIIHNACDLSNLKLKIHGLYIKIGHAKTPEQAEYVKEYFNEHLPKFDYEKLTFFEKVYVNQAYVWYHYILLDFEHCIQHAVQWVQMFVDNPGMIEKDADLYMRGLHYLLSCLYGLDRIDEHAKYMKYFGALEDQRDNFNTTSKMIYFLYYYTSQMDHYFLTGDFKEGLELVPEIEAQLTEFESLLDIHRIMVFNYRIAWMNFGDGKYDKSIDYLNNIIQLKVGHLREDIQCYARILHLLCHLEMENYMLLEYLEKSVSRFVNKMREKNKVQTVILSFIRKQVKQSELNESQLAEVLNELKLLSQDRYERRAFIYMDVIPWAQGKLNNESMSTSIKKALTMH